MTERFVPTSVARRLIARMRATHERRRISIFSGPPGIGKTTAIDEFRSLHPDNVVVAKIARRPAKEMLVLQHAIESFRRMTGAPERRIPRTIWLMRTQLFKEICAWSGLDPASTRAAHAPTETEKRLTFVFDEAQNLGRGAIEVLRYWNDADRCYAPFPVGLIFVGNNEFSLSADVGGESPISSAVADRALHIQALEYGDVTDADIEMFVAALGITERSSIDAILRFIRKSRSPRSLRRVADLIDDLKDLAEGQPLTGALVHQLVALT
jgi:DNA transposition AAA+ family ATPase